jgi:hypothetical protein
LSNTRNLIVRVALDAMEHGDSTTWRVTPMLPRRVAVRADFVGRVDGLTVDAASTHRRYTSSSTEGPYTPPAMVTRVTGRHGCDARVEAVASSDNTHGNLEIGTVAEVEKLFRIGTLARSAHFYRRSQFEIQ